MSDTTQHLKNIRHIKICYSKNTYCGHPRQSGIFNFGNGEIAVMHAHSHSTYMTQNDVSHSFTTGYSSRARILLQRSVDHGESWPSEHKVTVWDESRSTEEKREILYKTDSLETPREYIDLNNKNSTIFFARPVTGEKVSDRIDPLECFSFRSKDKGKNWETVPTRISPPYGMDLIHFDGGPLAKFSDGTHGIVGTASTASFPRIQALKFYATDDNGLSWNYISEIDRDPTGQGVSTYGTLLLLPNGRLQCYMINLEGFRNCIQMNYSDDGGYSWSNPTPVVKWGNSPWLKLTRDHVWSGARKNFHRLYRSPWPIQLKDGRIVILYGRRKPPYGIGLILSEDQGLSWSDEVVLRADGSNWDLGYPVATELDDGRIFTAYYYMQEDGNGFGGTRHIAGSFFQL